MTKKNYIRLNRSIMSHWVWPVGRAYTECEAWIWLLMKAAHSIHKGFSDKKVLTVYVGEILTSIKELSDVFGWGWRRTKCFLENLKNDEMIDIADGTRYSIRVIINNYAAFQGKNDDGCRADDIADSIPDGIAGDELTAELTSLRASQRAVKDTPIIKGNKDNKYNTSSKFSEQDFLTAEFILSKIRELNPTHKEPNLTQWADTIRLMREQDNRTDTEIRELFSWANQDSFWSTNVLSPASLRTQWDKLTIKKGNKRGNHSMNSAYSGETIIV